MQKFIIVMLSFILLGCSPTKIIPKDDNIVEPSISGEVIPATPTTPGTPTAFDFLRCHDILGDVIP